MLQISVLGKQIPEQCAGDPVTRIFFRSGNLSLVVPSALELKAITYYMQRGVSLVDAYKDSNVKSLIPHAAMRACVSQVLKTQYYDSTTGERKTTGGQFTCIGFSNCFDEYVGGQFVFPQILTTDRRMRIASEVFAPSWSEEACIKAAFMKQTPLEEAYRGCGASDIIPDWPGALQFIETAFISSIASRKPLPPLYEVIKRSHQLYALQPPAVSPPLSPPPASYPLPVSWPVPVSPAPREPQPAKSAQSALVYLVIGGIVVLMLARQ